MAPVTPQQRRDDAAVQAALVSLPARAGWSVFTTAAITAEAKITGRRALASLRRLAGAGVVSDVSTLADGDRRPRWRRA